MTGPVLPLQSLHSRELLRVGGHERRAMSSRLASEKDIVGADRLSHRLELSSNDTCRTRIVCIEYCPFERTGKEGFEPPRIGFLPLALGNAVPELKGDDRRQQEHALASDGPLKSSAHIDLGAVDQRDAGVRVKQVRRHSKTRRSGVRGCRRPSGMKGSDASQSSSANQADTSVKTGSTRIPRPARRTLTRSLRI